jgi:hypothetical protein
MWETGENIGSLVNGSHYYLVKLLRESFHNGFPVVDPTTKSHCCLVGMCNIGKKEKNDTTSIHGRQPFGFRQQCVASCQPTPSSRPESFDALGVPHIKNDRYDYLANEATDATTTTTGTKTTTVE